MPTYIYKARKGPGDLVQGELTAKSEDGAISKLDAMGLTPISVLEKKGGAQGTGDKEQSVGQFNVKSQIHKPRALSSIKVKSKEINAFTWQLASLVKSNVPMLRALTLITQQTESASLKRVVSDLEKQVKDGKMLSEAMQKYSKIFSNLFLSMIKSGESGGVLAEVLYKLAEYQEKEQGLKRKIQSALAYPMVMLVVGVGTVFVMITFFMPKFIRIFENMRQELPMPTKILIALSRFMSTHWYWFIFSFVFIAVLFGRSQKSGKRKFLLDMIKLNTPFVKKFVRDSEIAKFCRALGLLLKNGLPVYESLSLATNTLDNEALREPLIKAGEEIIKQGSTLSSSLNKIKVFPSFAVNMIAVGEEGGKLEESLIGIAESYEREVDQSINIMTSLIEPILILLIGGIVGFIVFAMLLPIFNIGMAGQG